MAVLAATQLGVSLGTATARQAGLRVEAVHAQTAGPAGDLADSDVMSPADAAALIEQGQALGSRVAADGLICLGEAGIGNTTIAAALSCVLLDLDPTAAAGLGASADAAILVRKQDVVSRAVGRARAAH